MAKAFVLSSDDEYREMCGEVLHTAKGRLVFHCLICDGTYEDSVEFLLHLSLDHNIEDNFANDLDTNTDDYLTFLHGENDKIDMVNSVEEIVADRNKSETTPSTASPIKNWVFGNSVVAEQSSSELLECCICSEILESEDDLMDHMRQHANEDHDNTNAEIVSIDYVTTSQDSIASEDVSADMVVQSEEVSRQEDITDVTQSPLFVRKIASKSRSQGQSRTKLEKRRYKCKICGIAMSHSSNIVGHIRRHCEENKRYQCSYCPKKFFSRTEQTFHERVHTGERPYLCAECGASFRSAGQLTYHSRLHKVRERKFKCSLCDKAFYDKYRLNSHMNVHKEERDHVCVECNAAFKHQKALAQHLKIHRNKREYECKICGARFNQGPGLRSHLKSLHQL